MTAQEQILRTGHVTYLAGYEQNRHEVGNSPVYKTARVVEYTEFPGEPLYFPDAPTRTLDGGVDLPDELKDKVIWDR